MSLILLRDESLSCLINWVHHFLVLEFQLLEMLMNNIGEAVHKQVIEAGLLPVLVKIVKKKVFTLSFVFLHRRWDSMRRLIAAFWPFFA